MIYLPMLGAFATLTLAGLWAAALWKALARWDDEVWPVFIVIAVMVAGVFLSAAVATDLGDGRLDGVYQEAKK